MIYRAIVQNGVITLPADHLPEGAEVTLQLLPTTPLSPPPGHSPADHRSEVTDRLLGLLHHSSAESIRAQQHLDRHL
ncbi:MAG TPA: hypothetical protein VFE58_12945 [Tepidisphaeraceae bacterium]|jgi:hypothetical protein|nr:hypothetical protein [Tepidisphaeraceae bacterium]